ncbi:molybdopterin synthase sulfur carrier subunit [Methanosarcinales archaeon ex4484_138]|nr:MAG: molybdopterin synthase sulfur carrier subunit [Methanosarcinales archaeon ex4484_138]
MVRIRFSQALNRTTKERETTINLTDEITVRELINKLTEKYGKELERRLLEEGELKRFINIYIDGEDIRYNKKLETQINDTNEVSILPAISGG